MRRAKLASCLAALLAPCALAAITVPAPARADTTLRLVCYDDNNECETTRDLAAGFTKAHPGVSIDVEIVPYRTILQALPVQLASGHAPDMARVTDFGTLSPYMLDLAPDLKDADFWRREFGQTLDWMRFKPGDTGIYGLLTQLTVTAPFVDATLFQQANVPLPGPKATWDDWAAAVAKVAKATNTPFGMAWDRSGHRFASAAISYGAKYFAANGTPQVTDPGFDAIAAKFVQWNKDHVVDPDIWGGVGGSTYRDAFPEFLNGRIVLYLSGSWQLLKMSSQVGQNFDWRVVPEPCGPAGCTGMPGGAAFVGFKSTPHPELVAAFLDYLAQPDIYRQLMVRTGNLPAEQTLLKQGLDYNLPPQATAAIRQLGEDAAGVMPLAYRLQGYRYNRVVFNATVERLSQAITGQITLQDALGRIDEDVAQQIQAAGK